MTISYGARSMTQPLRRVLVRPPQAADAVRWREYGWRAEPNLAAAVAEHEALREILEGAGAEVIVTEGERGNPDAIYAYDPLLVGERGAVLLRPGKDERLGEAGGARGRSRRGRHPDRRPDRGARDDRRRRHALARPRDAARRPRLPHERRGRRAARALFPDAEVLSYDLPHWNGRAEVMHLMSLISPLDDDLALVYPRLAPVRLMELLHERGIEIVEVPDEEFETMGPNVLALGPRHALALEGNDETRRRMEAAGVEVLTYRGDEISRKGDGGPTCLTRPLLRA